MSRSHRHHCVVVAAAAELEDDHGNERGFPALPLKRGSAPGACEVVSTW